MLGGSGEVHSHWSVEIKCVWGRKPAEERSVTLYRLRIPGRKSQILQWTRMETWYKQQDLFEGNDKILRGRGYLAWLNADMSQATHRPCRSVFTFSLFISFYPSFPLVSRSVRQKKKEGRGSLSNTELTHVCLSIEKLPTGWRGNFLFLFHPKHQLHLFFFSSFSCGHWDLFCLPKCSMNIVIPSIICHFF